MSILIKGLDLPTMPDHIEQGIIVPYIDVRIFADGTAVTSKNKSPYYKQFTAVPVPTPHGRLIDADALIQEEKINSFEAVFAVAEAPTIIEAEGENEN